MLFNPELYKYNCESCEANICEGAFLYRLTSIQFSDKTSILNGFAPMTKWNEKGRFHDKRQLTSYCSNNVLVCIAEVLFHMYRSLLKDIGNKVEYKYIHDKAGPKKKRLAIFTVKAIDNLIHLDSEGVEKDYDSRIAGTMVVFPDQNYRPFNKLNNRARKDGKTGIIYPSARHSKDICVALFNNQCDKISDDFYKTIEVELRLIREDQDFSQPLSYCNPFQDKLHPTMGYYKFTNKEDFDELNQLGALNPSDIPQSGIVDFVRRRYKNYPFDATREIKEA